MLGASVHVLVVRTSFFGRAQLVFHISNWLKSFCKSRCVQKSFIFIEHSYFSLVFYESHYAYHVKTSFLSIIMDFMLQTHHPVPLQTWKLLWKRGNTKKYEEGAEGHACILKCVASFCTKKSFKWLKLLVLRGFVACMCRFLSCAWSLALWSL